MKRKKIKVIDKSVRYGYFYANDPVVDDDGDPVTWSSLTEAKRNRKNWGDGGVPMDIKRITTELLDV